VKTLLWLVLFLIGLAGVALPAVYLHAASQLPQLETEFDLEKQLRNSIEGERMSLRAGTFDRSRSIEYKRPEFARLPKDLVALYIAQLGCPTYFQTPREDGPAWAWRLFSQLTLGSEPPGDGACERLIATRLAMALGIQGNLELTVATHRLHSFLQKDQLIAYDLSALYFDRGIVGVEDAAFKVFGRELDALQLPELAELALTLPPHSFYQDAVFCRNASLIRQNRDVLLDDLAAYKLVTEERASNARSQPVDCVR
jgi:hypothetical protein